MEKTYDKDGYIIMDVPEPIELPEKKPKRASTVKPTATAAPASVAIINAKLDALLRAQKISPTTIERQVMDEVTQ